ncbi:MAG: hypothetical protein FWF36_03270 [Propionibacteriaceae bacterium]|nr:hypothetical protein [Propionibacteriaceae bacterium]
MRVVTLSRPALARSVNIVKASGGDGDSNAPAGIAAIDAHEKIVGKITHIIADRGYTQAEAKNWALLLWIRSISQTSDLRDDQRIVETGPVKGTIWCDGWLYTNAMPEKLRHLPRLDNDNLTVE